MFLLLNVFVNIEIYVAGISRYNTSFPDLMLELRLTGYRGNKLIIKIEFEQHIYSYEPENQLFRL